MDSVFSRQRMQRVQPWQRRRVSAFGFRRPEILTRHRKLNNSLKAILIAFIAPVLIPGTCECVILCDKRDLVNVIKLRILK